MNKSIEAWSFTLRPVLSRIVQILIMRTQLNANSIVKELARSAA